MSTSLRWEPCVNHRGQTAKEFVRYYFAMRDRQEGLITRAEAR